MRCTRCVKREAVPGYGLCRACRYYMRSGRAGRRPSAMRQINVRLPDEMLDALLQEAAVNDTTLAATVRARLKAGMA